MYLVKDCLKVMQQGTEFIKLRANVKQFRRKFTLDADLAHIRWTPTNKKPHKARSKYFAYRFWIKNTTFIITV